MDVNVGPTDDDYMIHVSSKVLYQYVGYLFCTLNVMNLETAIQRNLCFIWAFITQTINDEM